MIMQGNKIVGEEINMQCQIQNEQQQCHTECMSYYMMQCLYDCLGGDGLQKAIAEADVTRPEQSQQRPHR